jgi:alpha-methylacyl-CoA racemase
MVDGAALLLGGVYGLVGAGLWNDNDREGNMLDGGSHFYGTYECKDGKFVSVGSIEPQFYALLLEKTGLKGESLPAQQDRKAWAQLRSRLAGIFRSKTRDEWCQIMEGSDVCFAPVLTMKEASQHPHAKARGAYVDVSGFAQPAPAPRFSRTKEGIRGPAAKRGQHTDEVLAQSGFSSQEIGELRTAGVVGPQ